MILRTVKCSVVNQTGETLALQPDSTTPNDGVWAPAPPDSCDKQVEFTCSSNGSASGATGQATYAGAGGSVVLTWQNPLEGSNTYDATTNGGGYLAGYSASLGRDATVIYTITKKVVTDGDQDGAPTAVSKYPDADDHSHQSHVPLRSTGPVVLSPKVWLIDIAWQAVNHLEWDTTILEITENRHGENGGSACPQELLPIDRVLAGSPGHETCKIKHSGLLADDFYSWCGDYVSWVFWKAWMVKNGGNPDEATRQKLVKFLNREALRSVDPDLIAKQAAHKATKPKVDMHYDSWQSGQNLSMFEAFAKDTAANGGLLIHHPFKLSEPDAYEPRPGDVIMANRRSGGHISIVAYFDPKASDKKGNHRYITLDGKSFDENKATFDWGERGIDASDKGWLNPVNKEDAMPPPTHARVSKSDDATQGVSETGRQTSDTVEVGKDKDDKPIIVPFISAWIDTGPLREMLGYR